MVIRDRPTTQPTEPTPQPTDATEPTNEPQRPTDPIEVPSVNYAQVIYASPNGTGSGKTANDSTDVRTAINDIAEGGIIYLLEGTYTSDKVLTIPHDKDGSAGKLKTMAAYPGATVKFDFSSQPYELENGKAAGSNQRGISLDADYWHLYGFEVYGAADNGIYVTGSNNIVEMVVLDGNRDTGLQISRRSSDLTDMKDWPSNNLIKNCTAYNNCDDATMENADGFAAKLTCGEGNVFDGCIAYNNSDDGWDLYAKEATGPIGVVTIRNCIAFRNGFTTDGRGYGDCDGNGFKLGGGGIGTRHVIENCLAFENLNCGFTDNNNPEFGVMKNCTGYNNNLGGNGKANYMVYRCSTTATFDNMMSYYSVGNVTKTNAAGIKAGNDKFVGVMNNGVFYNSKYYNATNNVTMTNGIKLNDNIVTQADSDFVTLSV
ncbi:MAG: silent information regulator protein Sir2, partial [Oscillospiraceae bacterium]|nr:silent information regulator protein Sir2 [Oscillospiraceae bacterium]